MPSTPETSIYRKRFRLSDSRRLLLHQLAIEAATRSYPQLLVPLEKVLYRFAHPKALLYIEPPELLLVRERYGPARGT